MFKRNDSKLKPSRRRDRAERGRKKRRMMMEGLEDRRLLATLPVYTGPREIGIQEATTVTESETSAEAGLNDSFATADVINLGTLPGQLDTIDLIGNVGFTASNSFPPTFTTDIDTFAFDLRGGDILDIATIGAAGEYTVFTPDGNVWYGVDFNAASYPADSPLQTQGNSAFAQVIPEDGRYFVQVPPITTGGSYTMGLRVYRPSIESAPIGARQTLFIDLDGGIYPRSVFDDGSGVPQPGVIRIPGLRESLPLLGIQTLDDATFNRLIDLTIAETTRMFSALGVNGTNGDFDSTGNPGDFGFRVLNSRDHPDPGTGDPLVTRILLGGTVDDSEIDTIGISSTLDIGNFSMDDIVLGLLDGVLDVIDFPIAPTSSIVDAMGDFLAYLVAHEAGHSFGMRHTASLMSPQPFPLNFTTNIMDEGPGADFAQITGAGPDGIYGTIDDEDIDFVTDIFSYREGLEGFNFTADSLSQNLATGTKGGGISGRVFNDGNGNGDGSGDPGIDGVTVFADINSNGLRDVTEPFSITSGGGNYFLIATPGDYPIIASTPPGLSPTTPTNVPISVTATSSVVVDFGFTGIAGANITGFSFSDNNGNGVRDNGEGGVEGIFHYLDLDGDNRPDLVEPSAISDASGAYRIDFPNAGNFTIRQVVPAGFTQTSPVIGEHPLFFNGQLTRNYNFGLLPSRDFGDAPDTYGTTLAADGANHGITDGLSIGAVVDRELDGIPTTSADGDDLDGRILITGATEDDEDGVSLLEPLGPGARAEFNVTVNNTAGTPAYLQGFMDFNGNGVFTDPGEQFLTDILVPSGAVNLTLGAANGVFVDVPANAAVGTTYARFRLSQETGLGALGAADTGEVEDYSFPILPNAQIANNDNFSVSRNSNANQLDVLRNDFETVDNQLTIQNLNTTGTSGVVVVSNDRRSVFYTPPNGFIGRDAFDYNVIDEFGNQSTATAIVTVTFQSAVPIAIDDSFELPEGSVNRALNVLDNDVPSTSGGLSIISVTPGSAGGTISVIGGGQSLRYSPLPGFNGTEQFTYSVQDSAGSTSSAQVTINLLPGSRADDVVEFTIELFDPINQQQEITDVQVGDVFLVRVSVENIEFFASPRGVASGFLDLLYTDELVATTNTGVNPAFPFDITFGELFSDAGALQRGNSLVPGLIDEVGGVQRIDNLQEHFGPTELFTLRMQALSPGVALFNGDPADANVSETITLGSDNALLVNQLRFGSAELLISPATPNFTSAIDDSFPDGLDSDGNLISSATPARNRLDVLDNDNFGPTGRVREFGLVTDPTRGNVLIEDNGTPDNLNDDFLSYRADVNENGLESFTYVIVTDDGVRSTANVTFPVGNVATDVDIRFNLVDENGLDIANNQIDVGERVGIQVILEDTRFNPTFVFAGYLDMMYDNGLLQPTDTNFIDNLDFDATFGPGYVASAAVGTAARPGIIDEFGTLFSQTSFPNDNFNNPGLLGTVFFEAVAPGQARVVGGPADSSPFQDTLVFREDEPVPVSRIRYDVLNITVNSVGPAQNAALPQDVNADGFVSPIDALLVINEMGREESRFEGESNSSGNSQLFTDVNGDSRVSALDALNVINYLKTLNDNQSTQGESLATGTDLGSSVSADAAILDLSSEGPVGDSSFGSDSTGSSLIAANDTQDDDDDDDVLDLLADDVLQNWN